MARVGRKRTRIARKRCVREVRINVHHLFFRRENGIENWKIIIGRKTKLVET